MKEMAKQLLKMDSKDIFSNNYLISTKETMNYTVYKHMFDPNCCISLSYCSGSLDSSAVEMKMTNIIWCT